MTASDRTVVSGVFVILPRDQEPGINESAQLQKIVRLVSTVQYPCDEVVLTHLNLGDTMATDVLPNGI